MPFPTFGWDTQGKRLIMKREKSHFESKTTAGSIAIGFISQRDSIPVVQRRRVLNRSPAVRIHRSTIEGNRGGINASLKLLR
jgi:hypothetical protein